MDEDAAHLLAPVLHDVDACAGLSIRVQYDYRPPVGHWPPMDEYLVMVWTPDGSGTGVWTGDGPHNPEQLAAVADQVHEAVVEGRWSAGLSTSWPPCPWHADRHPLGVELREAEVVWACPGNHQVVCLVGQLTC